MIAPGSLPSTPFSVLCDYDCEQEWRLSLHSLSINWIRVMSLGLFTKKRIFQDLFSSFEPNTERDSIRIIATQTESYTNAASTTYYSSVLQFLIMCFTRRGENSPCYMQISWDFLVSIWQKGMFRIARLQFRSRFFTALSRQHLIENVIASSHSFH